MAGSLEMVENYIEIVENYIEMANNVGARLAVPDKKTDSQTRSQAPIPYQLRSQAPAWECIELIDMLYIRSQAGAWERAFWIFEKTIMSHSLSCLGADIQSMCFYSFPSRSLGTKSVIF